jgi:hypothetical protein
MPSYKKFQNNFTKYAGHANQFAAPKSMVKPKDYTDTKREKIIDWTTFYRRNVHRFIQHYFGVQLHLYQIIWLYFMSICESFVTIASRASAKSWLIGLLALARGVLYPNSEIVVVAATMKQAKVILGKIEKLRLDYPNIAREIADLTMSQNDCKCLLHNGSTVKVVACAESGRGERSTFTIGEEFRIMDKIKYDSIVKPFAYARQTPYLKNPEYAHLIEEPREVLISSAYHKGLWWYEETLKAIKMMQEGFSVGFIAFDYLLAIKHGIKTAKQIAKEKTTMDEITFMEEYENIPFGENANAYFKLEMFTKNRKLKKSFYPQRKDMVGTGKNKASAEIKRIDGEIRLLAADISTRRGRKNDNTILTCIRLLPTTKGYQREFVYMESYQGEHTGYQSLRIKQLYYDFEADYLVLDLAQVGISVFEQLATVTKDDERGIEYDAFTVYEHKSLDKTLIEELKEKTLSTKALPVIYPIQAYAKLNSDIAVNFRDNLQRGMCSFLINETEAEVYLSNSKNREFSNTQDLNLKAWYLHPYAQFSELINETVALEFSVVSGNIKLETTGSMRKDRYTSCSYGSYFADLLEQELLKEDDDNGLEHFVKYSKKVTNTSSALSKIFR